MKLTYRGVSYEYTAPQVEVSNSNTVGKYRGLDIRFRNPIKAYVQQPTLELKYRGLAYTTGTPEAVVEAPVEAIAPAPVAPVIAPSLSMEDKARTKMMGHHRVVKQRQQAMLSRLAEEVGLSAADATHYWNHIQGKVHPSFWATYDRSAASLS